MMHFAFVTCCCTRSN